MFRHPVLPLALAASLAAGFLMPVGAAVTAARPSSAPHALDPANFDTTCAPCQDFFRYANGGWTSTVKIPASYSSWGSFQQLAENNRAMLLRILEDTRRTTPAATDSDARRLGTYWSACLDSDAAEAAGLKPIQPLLGAIDGMTAKSDLPGEVAWLHAHGVPALFEFRSAQDPKRSTSVIAFVIQGGLGLPDRDYYTRQDSASRVTRERYLGHVARIFEMLGRPHDASAVEAGQVMALETELAMASMTNVQRRDPTATYHKMPLDSLRSMSPGFAWNTYLARRGARVVDSVNVTQPDFVRALERILAARPLAEWQTYLRWKVADDAAALLTQAFADEDFRFRQVLTGAQVMQPRWKRCLAWTDQDLGDLLGNAYVQRRFPPQAKARALGMVKNLEAALGERIAVLEWMGPETRRRALGKLHAFEEKIGAPDHLRNFGGVRLSRGALFENHLAARAWEATRNIGKIGRPVDRGEWNMTSPTVNAYYSSSLNTINFPAGILQPPFYDPAWDDPMNYGGIGAVIGHEMTHGFDDRGRQFDAEGNLRDWWTADDAARYKVRSDRVAEQFNGYTVLDTVHVNGRLTLGENIADLGGIAVAYAAMEKALAGKPRVNIGGFTPEQRFFLSYAQVWRSLQRPEALRTQVQTNPHSPAVWRVDGPLSNLPEFAKAFGCKPGDPMVRPDSTRARIW